MKFRPFTRFRNSSIRTKYLWAVASLVTVLTLCGMYLHYHTSKTLYKSYIDNAEAEFQSAYEEMERFEERLNHLATLLQSDTNIVNLLSGSQNYTLSDYQHARQDLLPRLYSMLDGSNDYFCRLYVDSSLDMFDRSSRLLMLNDVQNEEWAQKALSGWGWRYFFTQAELHADEPALIAPIRCLDDRQQLVAMLRIDINPAALERIMTVSQGSQFLSFCLQTTEGSSIASTGVAPRSMPLAQMTAKEKEGFPSFEFNRLSYDQDTIFHRRLTRSGWRMALTVHHNLLNKVIWSQSSTMYIVAVLLVLVGMLCSLPILWHTTARIRRFYEHVRLYNLHTGTLKHITPERLQPQAEDEIGMLIREHNAMLDRIDGLIQEQDTTQEELRQMEITALQAQIKPHFLYNTLEAITWMARMHQPDKVESTVFSLTRFYRLCLSRGADVLPLETELEIIRHYFSIASSRYESKYTLAIDVDPQALHFKLPKITLQPLVENALIHGLLESGKDEGFIRVYTQRTTDGTWQLCIADTGGHFTIKKWQRVISRRIDPVEGKEEGYGLYNVEKRLCLFFNLDHAMELDISQGGLSIIIIPLSR